MSVLASKEQCLLKSVGAESVGAVGWQPTGLEDVSTGIKRAVST